MIAAVQEPLVDHERKEVHIKAIAREKAQLKVKETGLSNCRRRAAAAKWTAEAARCAEEAGI